jgi:hypothetical protein
MRISKQVRCIEETTRGELNIEWPARTSTQQRKEKRENALGGEVGLVGNENL